MLAVATNDDAIRLGFQMALDTLHKMAHAPTTNESSRLILLQCMEALGQEGRRVGVLPTPVKKPRLDIQGMDGNAFAIIAAVRRKLMEASGPDVVAEFASKVDACDSYDELLQLTMKYVEWS